MQHDVTLNRNLEQDGGHPATGEAKRKVPSYQRVSSIFQSGPLYRTPSDALDKGGGGGEVAINESKLFHHLTNFEKLHALKSAFHDAFFAMSGRGGAARRLVQRTCGVSLESLVGVCVLCGLGVWAISG